MKSFKKIGLLLLIICFLLFIASLYFLIAGINNIHNNQTIGIEYIGIAFSGFVAFGTILLVLATFYTLFESKITGGIPDDFQNILDLIIKNYPKYLKNLIKLIKRIKSSDEFNELENRLKLNPNYKDIFYLKKIKDDYIKLIVLITLDYTNLKYTFPNLYDLAYNDKEYDNIEKIGTILKNSKEVTLTKTNSLKYEVKEKVEKLNKKINGILNDNTLILDECDYLKKIRI